MLNPDLYGRLQACYGNVRIANEDTDREEYRIDCPICSDTRKRCSIHHSWGVYDYLTGQNNRWGIYCFNETNCFSISGNGPNASNNIDKVYSVVYGSDVVDTTYVHVKTVKKRNYSESVQLPTMILLDDLVRAMPQHQAIQYLSDLRGYDPIVLGQKYRMGYATSDNPSVLHNRIVIPFYVDGICRSWTARYIGDVTPNGKTLKEAGIQKYYNSKGTPVNSILFNIDNAKRYRFIVIAEGAFSALKIGENAIATNTKRISTNMLGILSRWSEYHSRETTVAIMYDPNQSEDEKTRGIPHHIDTAVEAVRPLVRNVFAVWLPKDKDPGDLTKEINHKYINYYAENSGIELDWRAYHAKDFTAYASRSATAQQESGGLGRVGGLLLHRQG